MANRSSSKGRASGSPSCSSPPGLPSFTEPEVRRWPHPVECAPTSDDSPASSGQLEPLLTEIHRALSRQVQLLAEIRSLLDQDAAESASEPKEK